MLKMIMLCAGMLICGCTVNNSYRLEKIKPKEPEVTFTSFRSIPEVRDAIMIAAKATSMGPNIAEIGPTTADEVVIHVVQVLPLTTER